MFYSRVHNRHYYVDEEGNSYWMPQKKPVSVPVPPPLHYETVQHVCVRNRNEGEYVHRLETRVKDITCVVLEGAVIPNTCYLVNSTNNNFTFNSTSITLHEGDYTPDDMAHALTTLLTGVTVIYSSQFRKFTFESSSSFTLSFKSKIANLLGFEEGSYTGSKITSTAIVDFSGLQLVKVKIRGVGIIAHIPVTSHSLIRYQADLSRFSISHVSGSTASPLISLSELNIELLDSDDEIISFEGGKHTLIFAITSRQSRPPNAILPGMR